MRRFAPVVALPDPKNSDFPSRINSFATAELQDTCRSVVLTSGWPGYDGRDKESKDA
jgi:hypothetical protein